LEPFGGKESGRGGVGGKSLSLQYPRLVIITTSCLCSYFSPLQSLGRRKRAYTSQNKTRNLCHFASFPFYITSQAQPQFLTDLLKICDCHALRSRFSASPPKKLCYKDAYLRILAQFLAFKHNRPFKKRSKLTPYLTELFFSLLYRRALRH
jgi:hypothetical protein